MKVRADFPILDQQVNGRPLVYLDSAASNGTETGFLLLQFLLDLFLASPGRLQIRQLMG